MKKFLYTLILTALIFITTPTTVHAETLIWSDNFNYSNRSGLSGNWSMDSHVGMETFLCGTSGPNCVKLASTQDVPGAGVTAGDGYINNTFSVTPGATYRARVSAGVYSTGSSPDGRVTIIIGDGITSTRTSCTQSTCPASGSQYSTELSVTFTPQTSSVTVWLEGTQGGCVPTGCHDTGVDDFKFYKVSDPVITANDAATCTPPITINSGNPIYAGQTYSATVSMRNDGNTTWNFSSGYKLGAQDPQDDPNWGTSTGGDSTKGTRPTRKDATGTTPTNTGTFTFDVTAPDTAGTYRFAYQMIKEGTHWFGGKCQPNITVSATRTATLRVSCSPSPISTTTSQNVTWTTTAVGGEGSHNYTWAGDDSLSGSGTKTYDGTTPTTHSINKTYTTAGTKAARVKVTSTDGQDTGFVDCSPSATISAPFNYSFNAPSNITVTQGSSGSTTISLTKTAGTAQSVSLSSGSPIPAGASKGSSPNPVSCTPNTACDSIFTISTSSTTPVGTYPITITGASTGVASKTTSFNLIVQTSSGGAVPTVNIRANDSEGPISIAHNTAATLSWTTTNSPTSCSASGSWSGSKSTASGSTASTGNLAGPNSYPYTLTCSNGSGSNSDTVIVNVAAAPGVPSCSLSASPSSGIGSFPSTITVTYANLASSPGAITVACGTGTNATASSCTGTNGSCNATCTYPAVSSTATYNATATIGSVTCSPTTVTDNPPGGGGSTCPWIQTTGGSVHSNTGIDSCSD